MPFRWLLSECVTPWGAGHLKHTGISLTNRLGKKPYSHRLSVSFHDFQSLQILNQQLCTTRKPHYLSSYLQYKYIYINNLPQNKEKVPQQAFNSLRRYNFLTIVDLFFLFPYCVRFDSESVQQLIYVKHLWQGWLAFGTREFFNKTTIGLSLCAELA